MLFYILTIIGFLVPPSQAENLLEERVNGIELRLKAIESGRQTITGVPYFLKGTSVSASGITFADGTIQVSSQPTSLHLLAGATMFVDSPFTTTGSTITVGARPTIQGVCHTIISTTPAGGTTQITFSGSFSTTTIELEVNTLIQTTNSRAVIKINDDATTANYDYMNITNNSAGTSGNQISAGLAGTCVLTNNAADTLAGKAFNALFRIFGQPGNPNITEVVMVYANSTQSGGTRDHITGRCIYTGSAPMTSFALYLRDATALFQGPIKLRVCDNQ